MAEETLAGTLRAFSITPQQRVNTGLPFAIARDTAQRVDPMGSVLQGVQLGGLLGTIASERQRRDLRKLQREQASTAMERAQKMRDIINQSVTVNAETGGLEVDRDRVKAGLLAGGLGEEAMAMDAQDAARQRAAVMEAAKLANIQAQTFQRQAEGTAALRPPGGQTLAERAAAGDPIAQQAVEEQNQRRTARQVETQRQLVDIMAAREQASRRAERQRQADLPLAEGMPKTATRIYDTQTGALVNQGTPTGEVRQLLRQGQARVLSPKQANALNAAQAAIEPVRRLRELMVEIYGPGGIYENLRTEGRFDAAVRGAFGRLLQTDPALTEANRVIQANVDSIRRAFQGQVGTQTEQDARRGIQALPRLSGIPDSRDVAFRSLNNVMSIVNRIFRSHLGNRQFQLAGVEPLTNSEQRPPGQQPSEPPAVPVGTPSDPLGIR